MVVSGKGELLARANLFSEELLVCDVDGDDEGGPIAPVPKEEEEIFRALVLGTRDYVEKNRFPGTIIGLSGGIDSSLVAVVAVEALGPSRVTGVTLSSPYTSPQSVEDAHGLAKNLGIRCIDLSIREPFSALLAALAEPFRGTPPDTTEENIQARIRGTMLMALSNKFGSLVLTTGNKSEMSVGYATLYGDMAGGFAVIKDLYKTMVYRVSRYYNGSRGRAVIPERVLTRPPSAELRPDQKDSDSLPAYETLDPILRMYVEKDRSVPEMVAKGFPEEVVRKVVSLVDRSEYKRRQAPPGVKITPRALGKDRRMPITGAVDRVRLFEWNFRVLFCFSCLLPHLLRRLRPGNPPDVVAQALVKDQGRFPVRSLQDAYRFHGADLHDPAAAFAGRCRFRREMRISVIHPSPSRGWMSNPS
jgi:NAD+ synthase (glutamine-hydrolysing)